MVSSNKKDGRILRDSQFQSFTCYPHLKITKLDDSVVALLRLNGKLRYQIPGGWWGSKTARVVKDDGVSETNVRWMFIEEFKRQVASLQAKEVGLMIMEMANIKAEDDIEKHQTVKLKL
jgi:hypothetical protein